MRVVRLSEYFRKESYVLVFCNGFSETFYNLIINDLNLEPLYTEPIYHYYSKASFYVVDEDEKLIIVNGIVAHKDMILDFGYATGHYLHFGRYF